MENSDIPLWPQNHNGPRRMIFMSGEARWYLWLQEGNRQEVTSLRRDLLLLHQNGDLQLFRDSIPPAGTYITALHAGKMIRGRICPTQNLSDSSRESLKQVCAIDVDEGCKLNLPLNQVRVLPIEMKSLPCQAVRVDIGLDCLEQFEWPAQLNNMLIKAIEKALIFVDMKKKRPGSIPTIDADVTIVNPSTGQSMSIQKWLIEFFSQHLDLCGLEKYKPFPVGMSPQLMVNNMPNFQQPVFGFGLPCAPPSNAPSILPPSMQAGMPIPLSMPQRFPLPATPPMVSHKVPHSMLAGCPLMFPPPPVAPIPSSNIPFPMPAPHGPTINATLCHFSVTPGPVRPAPSPPLSRFKDSPSKQNSSESSSTGVSATSSVIFRSGSDTSTTSDSDTAAHGESSVGIDLNGSFQSSSSSGSNPNAPPFYPRGYQTPPKVPDSVHSVKVVELVECPTTTTFPTAKGVRKDEKKSSADGSFAGSNSIPRDFKTPPRGSHSVKVVELEQTATSPTIPRDKKVVQGVQKFVGGDSSSSLSAEAAPFVSKLDRNKSETINKSGQKLNLSATQNLTKESQEKCGSSSKATTANVPHGVKSDRAPTPLCKTNAKPCQSEPSVLQFPRGNEVQLKQILRDWKVGQVVSAFMARVWNPSCFEVNVIDEFCGLLSRLQMEMNEYHKVNKINISSKQQARDLCGDFCAFYDPDEDLWLRGQVNEWFMDDSVTPLKVWAVDYGGYSQIDLSSVQPLMTELACTTPVLVTICSMKNITPRHDYDIWPEVHLNRVKELMSEDKQLYLRIDGVKSEDDIWPVSVFTDSECSMQSINEILVAEGCAYYVGMIKESSDVSVTSIYEDAEDPMAEAYELGGNNYDIDDEDACFAVSGRKVTDEKGICWFFQRNGYCYKKFCELRHERLDPDGHSTAKEPVHHDSFEKLGSENVLSPGSQVKLTVTRIMTVNHFIATLSTKGTKIRSRETLKSLIENLNSTQMKRQLKTFTEFPADGEIVLFKDNTGMFYRGRVICADMVSDDLYKVLNVDTGYKSKIPLKDLRRVDPAFLHHPFQAVECWLADVTPTQNDKEWTKSCNAVFADLVKNEKLIATIVRSAPWGIEVNLMNRDGQDIAVMLKEMNIVKSCPRRHLPLDESHRLPG